MTNEQHLPDRDELLAWWIFDKTDQCVDHCQLEVCDWLKEFRNSNFLEIYRYLWEEYDDFQEEFSKPPTSENGLW